MRRTLYNWALMARTIAAPRNAHPAATLGRLALNSGAGIRAASARIDLQAAGSHGYCALPSKPSNATRWSATTASASAIQAMILPIRPVSAFNCE